MDFVKLHHEPNPQDTEWCFFESTNKSWRVASKDSWPWINKHSWLKGASNEVKFNMRHHEKSCEKGGVLHLQCILWSDMNMSYNWLGQEVQVEKKTSSRWKMLKAFKVVATSYTLLYTNKLIMFHHDIYEVYIYIHELPNFFSQWPSLIPVIFWNIQQKQQVKWYKQGYQWFGPCRWWHWSRLPS